MPGHQPQVLAYWCLQTRTFCVQMGAPSHAQPPGICMPASWFPWRSAGGSESFTKIPPATKRHLIFHLQCYICFLFFLQFHFLHSWEELKKKRNESNKNRVEMVTPKRIISQRMPVLIVCVCAKLLQTCLILCHPMNCSPPGSTVHGTLQARILEWVAMPSPRVSS